MKVAVGVSGGVDSAVAVRLLQEAGHEVVGVTMTLGRSDEAKALAEARTAAERLGIELVVRDFSEAWHRDVVGYLRDTYLDGRTPNPCVRCNETVKFSLLPLLAFDELGCDRFATGHYARLRKEVEKIGGDGSGTETEVEGGRLEVEGWKVRLLRGIDRGKDQSYFLYRVKREILERTLLPLGRMTKAEVRAYAATQGLAVAEKGDSQDFCGGDAQALVGAADRPGEIVTNAGKVIGTHRGYWRYTVGMRRGLGVGGGTPFYVVRLDPLKNRVVVGTKEEACSKSFRVTDVAWLAPPPASDEPLTVKVRSAGEPKGPVTFDGEVCNCPGGLAGVAPGQSAVFYRGERILGGGIIAV